jgi:uncharacterized protein (UPF0248 family)
MSDEKDLIIFLDENDDKKEFFVNIIAIENSYVTFKTSSNIITIPINRILKIKRKENVTYERTE